MRKLILINSRLERAHSSQCSAVQCSTIKNYKYVNQQMIPFPITRNSSRAKQPLWVSRENVTGLLRWLQDFFQIKIENICIFKLIKKKHGNVFKKWLCPNFLLLPKKSELPKIWGGCRPPRPPPARTPMAFDDVYIKSLFRQWSYNPFLADNRGAHTVKITIQEAKMYVIGNPKMRTKGLRRKNCT